MLPKNITSKKNDKEDIKLLHSFYSVIFKEKSIKAIKIERSDIRRLLEKNNFYYYFIDKENTAIVRIEDKKIELYSKERIKSFLKRYILNLPTCEFEKDFLESEKKKTIKFKITASQLMDVFTNNSENLIDSNISNIHESDSIDFLHDTKREKYLFFKNKIVEITKNGIDLKDYSDSNKNIWRNQIIERDLTIDNEKGIFEDFVEKITGNDYNRKQSLKTIIGYLLHYNFNTNLKAIYFADVNEEFSLRSGGTGKGIIGKALKNVINSNANSTTYVSVSGEFFSQLKLKRYMNCEADTQLVHIEDATSKADVTPDKLVSDITEGINILKHYGKPHNRFVKLMVSTNFAMDFDSDTHGRRCVIFELKNYFSKKWTPMDEYKCMFFSEDWDEEPFKNEWNRFYTFMIGCCHEYMKHGIIEPETINYENRVIYETTCETFVVWLIAEVIEKRCKNALGEPIEYKCSGNDLFNEYITEPDRYATLSSYKQQQSVFCQWISRVCKHKSIRFARYQSSPTLYFFNPTPENWSMIERQRSMFKK